jgi:hypothetical protein
MEPVYGEALDPVDFREVPQVAHKGHVDVWLARGYRI